MSEYAPTGPQLQVAARGRRRKLLWLAPIPVAAIVVAILFATGAFSSTHPSRLYDGGLTAAAFRATPGDSIGDYGNTDYIAMTAPVTFHVTLAGAGTGAVLSFWPDEQAAATAVLSYRILAQALKTKIPSHIIERLGNALIVWDSTPNASDEYEVHRLLR